MNEREVYVPPGGPPQSPAPRIFEELGEEKIRRLLSLHYENLKDTALADWFPDDPERLEAAAQRSADFFIQVMGGPPLYSERHGPPRMRMRHMPFEITQDARDLWLLCFEEALDDLPFPPEHRAAFENFLNGFSMWMVNAR